MTDPTHRIVAYLAGELDGEADEAFELALLDGRLDGPDLDDLSTVVVGLREAAFLGILSIQASRGEMERLRTLGYRIVEVTLRPDIVAAPDLGDDFDLLFMEFDLDLSGVTRLDCEVCDAVGRPFKRQLEIPFHPDQRRISGFCARELALAGARQHPDGIVTRLLSVEPAGDRVIAEFRTAGRIPPDA